MDTAGTDAGRAATDGAPATGGASIAAGPLAGGPPARHHRGPAPVYVPGPRAWNRAEREAAAVIDPTCAVTVAAWAAHVRRPVGECLALIAAERARVGVKLPAQTRRRAP